MLLFEHCSVSFDLVGVALSFFSIGLAQDLRFVLLCVVVCSCHVFSLGLGNPFIFSAYA